MSYKHCKNKTCKKREKCKRFVGNYSKTEQEELKNFINQDECLSGGNFALFEPFTCGDCICFNDEYEVCVNGQSIFCADFRVCNDEPCYVFNRFEEEL